MSSSDDGGIKDWSKDPRIVSSPPEQWAESYLKDYMRTHKRSDLFMACASLLQALTPEERQRALKRAEAHDPKENKNG